MTLHQPLILQGYALDVPVRPAWVRLSLVLALLLTWLPWSALMVGWVPDFLLLTLLYWTWRAPGYAGIGTAFALGLLMDVERGVCLGGYALIYSMAAYTVLLMRVRMGGFTWWGRAAHMAPVLLAATLLSLLLGWLFVGTVAVGSMVSGVMAAVAWPGLAWLLDGTGRVAANYQPPSRSTLL